jgi:hypothetical protein
MHTLFHSLGCHGRSDPLPRVPSPSGLVCRVSVDLAHLCPLMVRGSHDPFSCQLISAPPSPFPGRKQLLPSATWFEHGSFPHVPIRALCKVPGALGSRHPLLSPQRSSPTAETFPRLLQGHPHPVCSCHQLCKLPGLQPGSLVPVPLLGDAPSCRILGGLPSLASEGEEKWPILIPHWPP